jgi:ubiquinone biosynthesis protein
VLLTDDGRLAVLDFGLLGRLDADTRATLALLLLALAQNRGEDVADLILGISLTTVDSDEAGFVHEVRRKLPRYHWRPLSGIRAGQALADLQRLALTYRIQLPASFALVGKTLAQADSIARTLDPELDPVEVIRDYALELIVGEAEQRLQPNEALAYALSQLEPVLRLPRRTAQLVDQVGRGSVKVGVVPTGLDHIEHVLRTVANRVGAAMIVVGLLVASALMARVSDAVALAGFCLSGVIGLYMVWRIVRTPGEF